MAKTKVKFETFLDGICAFWQLDEYRKPALLQGGIRFQRRVVGSKRNYSAEQAGHKIEKLIRVPYSPVVVRGCFVVIGSEQYQVIQVQEIPDTIPRCTDITLAQPDLLLNFDPNSAGAGGRL